MYENAVTNVANTSRLIAPGRQGNRFTAVSREDLDAQARIFIYVFIWRDPI